MSLLGSSRTPTLEHFGMSGEWPSAAQFGEIVPVQGGGVCSGLGITQATNPPGATLTLSINVAGRAAGVLNQSYREPGTWRCWSADIDHKYLPQQCRNLTAS
ncbi:MAG: pilin [Xanthomonadaceae bacterium]|nr:pilin [Xanthomonadaceae bacterium]